MSVVAVIPSIVPLFVVAAMRRAEARIHRQLVDGNALTPDSAIQLSLKRSLDRRRLQGLIDGGAVRVSSDSRYFLDSNGWAIYQSNRRRRVTLAVSVLVVIIGVAIAIFTVVT